VQFCVAFLQYVVDHAIFLKTSEVWRAAFFHTLIKLNAPECRCVACAIIRIVGTSLQAYYLIAEALYTPTTGDQRLCVC